jgi:hypothetical protein
MEQKESPANVAASVPDKENPYADLIIFMAHKSILEPMMAIQKAATHATGHLFDVGMMRSASGTYLNLYFSGRDDVVNPFSVDKNAVPDTVSIPFAVVLKLLENICVISKNPLYAECGEELKRFFDNNPSAVTDQ